MKKIILVILLLPSFTAFAQTPVIVNRASQANTVQDARLAAKLNFLLPRYNDTTAANLDLGLDSIGAVIFTRTDNKIWKRQGSPKLWVEVGGSSSVTVTSYGKNASLDSTILLLSDGTRYAAKDSVGGGGGGGSDTLKVSVSDTAAMLAPYLNKNTNRSAYTLFGRGSGTGAPSFLSSIDSNWVTGLHSEAYYNTKYKNISATATVDTVKDYTWLGVHNFSPTLNTINSGSIYGLKINPNLNWASTGIDTAIGLIVRPINSTSTSKSASLFVTGRTILFEKYSPSANIFPSTGLDSAALVIGQTSDNKSGISFMQAGNANTGYNINVNSGSGTLDFKGVVSGTPTTVMQLSRSGGATIFNSGLYTPSTFGFTGGTSNRFYLRGINTWFLGWDGSDEIVKLSTQKDANDRYVSLGGTTGSTYTNVLSAYPKGSSVGINILKPATSAALDVTSTTQGMLLPRMTTTQKNAIATPANALQLYDTDLKQPQFYDGVSWKANVGMIFGTAAPALTPSAVGNFFFDATNGKLYIAKATTSSSDWIILN